MLMKLYILNWYDHFIKIGQAFHLQILITQNQLEVSKGRARTGAHEGCSQDLEDPAWTTQVPLPNGSGTRGRQKISRKEFQSVGPLGGGVWGTGPTSPGIAMVLALGF